MFEDATFHSSSIQQSQTPRWMLLTLGFNLTLVSALIVLPLLHPDALPTQLMQRILYAPPSPSAAPLESHAAALATSQAHSLTEPLQPPRITPTTISRKADLGPAPPTGAIGTDLGGSSADGVPGGTNVARLFQTTPPTVTPPKPRDKPRLSSGVAEGLLISKSTPVYPPIARSVRVSGTVLLAAIISKTGTIENLRVLSGNPMLTGAAIDAVQTWRYQPYLLNNEPVEVETTIKIVFSLAAR